MPCCVLRYCKNSTRNLRKSSGITFHRFIRPNQDAKNWEKWIMFVRKNRSEKDWLPTNYTNICSLHFREEDFYTTLTGRRYLKNSALPLPFKPTSKDDSDTMDSPVESTSDSKLIFDTPKEIMLTRNLDDVVKVKIKLSAKIKKVQRKNIILKKECESLKSVVTSLRTKFSLDGIPGITEGEVAELHKRFLKKNKQRRQLFKYSPILRKFAITLNYYSPAAYKYVRNIYGNVLPHPRILYRWYGTANAEAGFTNEAFQALQRKSDLTEHPVVCTLIVNEMAIRRQRLFPNQQKLGAVNFGAGPQEGDDIELVASQALVFMLVSLTENWKLPVGYFLISSITPETKASLITTCLQKCHEVGVTVVSLTFDISSTNFSTAEILGCKLTDLNNIKTYFPHPSTQEEICVFVDPSHVMKLIRNTFERKRLFFDEDGKKVRWQLLINLNKLQQNENLRFDNKLTPRHIHFRNQVMKVKLATQFLSTSVAKTLVLCDELLKSTQFLDSSATVRFITLMNNFFDTMNSRVCNFYGFKRPIDKHNLFEIFSLLNKVKDYILKLEFHVKYSGVIKRKKFEPQITLCIAKRKVVESPYKMGFIGAIVCIESLKTLYKTVVNEKKLAGYISTYQLSQDHLEQFFVNIRKHSGYNNNPNALQFRAAYKKTLHHLKLRSSFTANCIPLDNFTILQSSSINIINSTTQLNRHDDQQYEVLPSTRILNSDVEAENDCNIFAEILNDEQVTSSSQLIVGYISGYISRILTKLLKCEVCVNSLTTTEKLPHLKLIIIEDMGGLCYSTEDVYKVCLTTETVIRKLIRQCGGCNLSAKFSCITVKTLECFIDKEVFTVLIKHSYNQPSTFNHRMHLIRAIIYKYTSIRIKHKQKLTKL